MSEIWSPLRQPTFAALWLSMLVSSTGAWMHETAAGWLMTSLTPSPAVVVLVQTANTLPIFLFALIAGALADRLDKRRFLVVVNTALALVVAVFALFVQLGWVTPALLVLLSFAIGTGAAFTAPAWQALLPELVEAGALKSAVALNSLGINISRAIGPAVAGLLIAVAGMATPFAVNAVTYLAVVTAVLVYAPRSRAGDARHREPMSSAIATGLRHASHNPALRQTILRASGFFFTASALWALLPLIARAMPEASASTYGSMTACIGVGAVGGALLLPSVRERWSTSRIASAGALLMALVLPALAFSPVLPVTLVFCLLAGLAWISTLTSFHISAQTALPRWVRARGLSIFLMTFFGAMTAGSLTWGQVAQQYGLAMGLLGASAGLLGFTLLTRRIELGAAEGLDLSPALHWPAAPLDPSLEDAGDRGPVMVTIDYRVAETDRRAFLDAIRELAGERYRDGAYQWAVQQRSDDPQCWQEWFLVESWDEHLRQHQRVTQSDREIQARVRAFHREAVAPVVRHWISAN